MKVARFLPLCISVVFAAAIAVLVMTPLAWHLMGRPAETYPELLYLMFGAPPAVILLCASAVIALLGGENPLRAALRPLWICMAATAVIAALFLSPLGYLVPDGIGHTLVDVTLYAAWPALLVWMVVASVWAWKRDRTAG